ncbi:hypothetical protein pb186bvf_020482 [Paramecium bursaria]
MILFFYHQVINTTNQKESSFVKLKFNLYLMLISARNGGIRLQIKSQLSMIASASIYQKYYYLDKKARYKIIDRITKN